MSHRLDSEIELGHKRFMANWRVMKVVKVNGKAPFDKWYDGLTVDDQAHVDDVLFLIESVSTIPPEKVKKYRDLYEVKISGNRTALRPLAIKDGHNQLVILLVGATKKQKIADGIYKSAIQLAKQYESGNIDARHWQED